VTSSVDKVRQGEDVAGQTAEDDAPCYPTGAIPLATDVGQDKGQHDLRDFIAAEDNTCNGTSFKMRKF